jgi:SAM-dependent methyltransferase
MPEYVYDQTFADERERLAGIERLWDAGTRATMERLGIAPGWRCLEVGAGGGSTVEWMAGRVGPEGRVLATDVYTKFLDAIELPNVEVREHDILAGDPLEPEFDLVYARLVVEHLGSGALRRMAAAVRPGGILLLEDYDWESVAVDPPQEEFEKVADAVLGLMAEAGFDPNFGRRLPVELEAAGLEDVEAEGRVRLAPRNAPAARPAHRRRDGQRPRRPRRPQLHRPQPDPRLRQRPPPELKAPRFLRPLERSAATWAAMRRRSRRLRRPSRQGRRRWL